MAYMNGKRVSLNGVIVLEGVGDDTTDATATAADIVEGATAYAKGEKITGNIPKQDGKTVTPTTEDQTAIAKNVYTNGDIIVKGDSNLSPENIAEGVSIFGVIGTHSGGGGVPDGYVTATFHYTDQEGQKEFSRLVMVGDNCPDPWVQERIDTPTKESTAQYDYTFNGWATADGGTADNAALQSITEDKVLYAAFAESVRMYTVSYYDGETLVHTEQVPYGGSSEYMHSKEGYYFNGWTPEPTNVTGAMVCYGEWVESGEIVDSWDAIIASVNDGTYKTKYSVGSYKPIDLGTEGIVNMQIVAFDTDVDKSGNKTHITFIAKELLKTKTVYTTNNQSQYSSSCAIYSYLANTVKPLIPKNVQSALMEKRNEQSYGSGTSTPVNIVYEYVWIPSLKEVKGTSWSYGNHYVDVYPADDDATRIKCIVGTDTPILWYCRDKGGSSSGVYASGITATGSQRASERGTNANGVCIGFCI